MEQGYKFSSGELEVSFQGLKARHVRYTTCSHFDGGKSSSVASLCTLDQLFILGFFPLRCIVQCSPKGDCEFHYPKQALLIIPPNDVWFQVCRGNMLRKVVV